MSECTHSSLGNVGVLPWTSHIFGNGTCATQTVMSNVHSFQPYPSISVLCVTHQRTNQTKDKKGHNLSAETRQQQECPSPAHRCAHNTQMPSPICLLLAMSRRHLSLPTACASSSQKAKTASGGKTSIFLKKQHTPMTWPLSLNFKS